MHPSESFRPKFVPIFLLVLVLGSASATAMIALREGFSLDWRALRIAWALGTVAAFVLSWAIALWFRIRVTPEGLRAYDFWSLPHFVPWRAISHVRRTNILGLVFLRVYAEKPRRPLWLPLFLTHPNRFWRVVEQHAGRNCALLKGRPNYSRSAPHH
jgi:hypothetical protein